MMQGVLKQLKFGQKNTLCTKFWANKKLVLGQHIPWVPSPKS